MGLHFGQKIRIFLRIIMLKIALALVIDKMSVKCEEVDTLLQVQVVFRHGDKTPEKIALYPKDPYKDEKWFPDGFGALTKLGKQQAYNIGKELRKTYNSFLGTNDCDITYKRSTNYDRTKQSLQLASAGLWPLLTEENLDDSWKNIPFEFEPMDRDKLFKFSLFYCKKYEEEYKKAKESDAMKTFLMSNIEKSLYINENTGLNCTKTFDLYMLYFALLAEDQLGLQLPQWTKKIYPEFLEQATVLEYETQTYNNEMRKCSGGFFINKIIQDAKLKINGQLIPQDRKLFLYSAHEFNLVYILGALNLFERKIPPYSSYIVFELHKIDDEYGFKIFYQDYTQEDPRLLTLPGCEEFCFLENFIKLTSDIIPNDEHICEI